MSLHIVIMAAGQGKRMHTTTPKVLHKLGGKPMLERVIDTARCLNPAGVHVIIGFGGAQIQKTLSTLPVHWIVQAQQLGTGDAVLQALPHIPDEAAVLVLSGDVPLIQVETLRTLVACCKPINDTKDIPLGLLVAAVDNPTGLGRIIRDEKGNIEAIVEEKDATPQLREINEIYSGICCAKAAALKRWLPKLQSHNAQGEHYLTDIIKMARAEALPILSQQALLPMEIQGVNNRSQLQTLERVFQRQIANQLMEAGVTLADAARIDVRGELVCDIDVFIDVNTIFSGRVVIGEGSTIGANCSLNEVTIGAHTEILPNSVLDGAEIGDHCHVGPFARLRPGTRLAAACKIGNFVETKNAVLDSNTKASHLSYLGDVTIGRNVNIGAGTITCNYDGVNKYPIVIQDGVFIGSDTQLIAPLVVGENATIGAGSTICKDVPAGELTLTEAKQKTIYGWQRPVKTVK